MPRVLQSLTFALSLLVAPLSFAQSVPAPGINQDIVSKIPERMRHFVDDKTVAGVVTFITWSFTSWSAACIRKAVSNKVMIVFIRGMVSSLDHIAYALAH